MSERVKKTVVLVVEDEWLLRTVAVGMVEDAGFEAIEAANADEAIAILESRTDITILFTDINMPGSIDGLKLAHAVRNRWPPVKIIIASGQVRLTTDEMPTGSRFFSKPYRQQDLTSALFEMAA
jgi:CheY-like chemotaxis protein